MLRSTRSISFHDRAGTPSSRRFWRSSTGFGINRYASDEHTIGLQIYILPLYISKSGQWLTGISQDWGQYGDLDSLIQQASPCYFNRDKLGRVVLEYAKKGLFSKPYKNLFMPY